VSQAFAADLPVALPAAYISVAAPLSNRGGIYIGINGGYSLRLVLKLLLLLPLIPCQSKSPFDAEHENVGS
jgi:hypothetical protein